MYKIRNSYLLLLCMLLLAFNLACADDEVKKEKSPDEATQNELISRSQALVLDITGQATKVQSLKKTYKMLPVAERMMFIQLIAQSEKDIRKNIDELITIQAQIPQEQAFALTLKEKLSRYVLLQANAMQQDKLQLIRIIERIKKNNKEGLRDQVILNKARAVLYELFASQLQNINHLKALQLESERFSRQLVKDVQLTALMQVGRLRIILDAEKEIQFRMEDVSESDEKALQKQLKELQWQREGEAKNLESMIAVMNGLGVDTTKFGQALVVATGEILNENVDSQAVLNVIKQLYIRFNNRLKENLPIIVFRISSFLLILFAFKLFAALSSHLINRAAKSQKFDSSQLLQQFLGSIVHKSVMIIGIIIALSQLGIEIGPLLAGMGIMGFVVGFALQDALSNFAAGVMILIYRPFDIGDFVNVAGISGEVKDMNLVSTTVLTVDRKRMIIPNTRIWGDIITNVTAEELRRVDLVFRTGYQQDINHVEDVLQRVVAQHALTLQEPAATIKLNNLGESSIEFIVRPWVKRQNYWEVYWDLTHQVKEVFDQEGIEMPYPQCDVHIKSNALQGI